jgi:hypothetical protein
MLAVTRLPPGAVCHVAYVDVKADTSANELARKAADQFARNFQCGTDEVKVIGEAGVAVALARHYSMIRKSGCRFFEKIMLKQKDRAG